MANAEHPTKGETAAGLVAVGGLVLILANFAIIGLPMELVAGAIYGIDQLVQLFGEPKETPQQSVRRRS